MNDPLTIQLLRLPEFNLRENLKLHEVTLPTNGTCESVNSERFLKQGSNAWKEARRGKINGSRAAIALGKINVYDCKNTISCQLSVTWYYITCNRVVFKLKRGK